MNIFKGGIPADYGGRISSVIDIKMNEGNSKKLNFLDHKEKFGKWKDKIIYLASTNFDEIKIKKIYLLLKKK